MSLRLILIRHAKSDWGTPALSDHDRPLNERGRRSAGAIGQWLAARGLKPGEVLSSDSTRTRESWTLIEAELASGAQVEWRRDLYHAGAGAMLAALQGAGAECVAMVGHNPGIADFADRLVATPPDHSRFADYPTGATLVAEFNANNWSEVRAGSGAVRDFVVPRDLIG